jgi:hypothetical protein
VGLLGGQSANVRRTKPNQWGLRKGVVYINTAIRALISLLQFQE